VELFGFLLSFILGVALRAIPTMVGIPRPGRSAWILAGTFGASVVLVAGSLLWLQHVADARGIVLLAGAGFLLLGLTLLALAWQTGVIRQSANRIRPVSRPHLWLVRFAFLWVVSAGLGCVYLGLKGLVSVELPEPLHLDAVRHVLGIGVVTNLIVGMSLMILPEFAGERLGPNRQTQLAFAMVVLINAAAVLRITPSLLGTRLSIEQRDLSMALGGSLAEVGLILFTLYLGRLFWRGRHGL
jgi:hypothetical protein